MDQNEWIQQGIDNGFVWSFCLNHDNFFSEKENEKRDEGDNDFCAYAFRLRENMSNENKE
jgi:hypothetical protein